MSIPCWAEETRADQVCISAGSRGRVCQTERRHSGSRVSQGGEVECLVVVAKGFESSVQCSWAWSRKASLGQFEETWKCNDNGKTVIAAGICWAFTICHSSGCFVWINLFSPSPVIGAVMFPCYSQRKREVKQLALGYKLENGTAVRELEPHLALGPVL